MVTVLTRFAPNSAFVEFEALLAEEARGYEPVAQDAVVLADVDRVAADHFELEHALVVVTHDDGTGREVPGGG
jgi:hypothetical protein